MDDERLLYISIKERREMCGNKYMKVNFIEVSTITVKKRCFKNDTEHSMFQKSQSTVLISRRFGHNICTVRLVACRFGYSRA